MSTIAAISTGNAPGGIGIVRISGEDAIEIAERIFRARSGRKLSKLKGYTAALGDVYRAGGERLDEAVALVFRAPKSYTGEDVVELSCHGGLYLTREVLGEALSAGAQPAGPGEFTKRAFLNGKMDLTEAESVMALVGAEGEAALRAAGSVSEGRLAEKCAEIKERLKDLCAHLAAWADFDDVPQITESGAEREISEIEAELSKLLKTYDSVRMAKEGVSAVIAGAPNVGKSTLMNLLTGVERSIVTPIPGTTRDVVEDTITLGGIPLRLADTAGLRDTDDIIESLGVRASERRLKTAELTLAVLDGSREISGYEREFLKKLDPERSIMIVNKADLPQAFSPDQELGRFPHLVSLSAKTGEGRERLDEEVVKTLGIKEYSHGEAVLITERQRGDILRAVKSLKEGREVISSGLTLDAVSVCAQEALDALCTLTGERVSDEIIDRVFENFCVGK